MGCHFDNPGGALQHQSEIEPRSRGTWTPPEALIDIAVDLTTTLSPTDRYQRVLKSIREVIRCDASSLLRFDGQDLTAVAIDGLSQDTLGKTFRPADHPRLNAILRARGPVRFAADDPRPDPFDELLGSSGVGRVHSCLGSPLRVGDEVVGVLTVDARGPGVFDSVDDRVFVVLAALTGAAMRTASLIETLEQLADRRGKVAQQLTADALQRDGGILVGQSSAMQALRDEIRMVANSDLTVLISGETGVGKELVARTVHHQSRRARQPLVYVNCAALPESIAESELFGHVRGAYTGAFEDRPGKFELADGGTLLLDEVGELPLSVQAKLLRALQDGEIQRVGADRQIRVDVRFLAATNRTLADEVADGRFRVDLFHRLSVYPIAVPALRERGEDIALLARLFADRTQLRLGLGPVRLAKPALERLRRYPWPGNVRELEHVITRAAVRAAAGRRHEPVVVELDHLGLEGDSELPELPNATEVGFSVAVDQFQRQLIEGTVRRCGDNWAAAARQLKLDRSNLHRLSRRLGLK